MSGSKRALVYRDKKTNIKTQTALTTTTAALRKEVLNFCSQNNTSSGGLQIKTKARNYACDATKQPGKQEKNPLFEQHCITHSSLAKNYTYFDREPGIMTFIFLLYFLSSFCTLSVQNQSTKTILIGGIFRSIPNTDDYKGFTVAIDFINNGEEQKANNIKFEGIAEFTDNEDEDEFDTVMKAITLVDQGAVAIIGPSEVFHLEAIQRLCPQLRTPQLAPFASGLTQSFNPCEFKYVLRMSPSDDLLFNVAADVIEYFKWTKVAVIRDNKGYLALGTFKDFLDARHIKLLQSEVVFLDRDISKPDIVNPSIHMALDSILKAEARIIVMRCGLEALRTILQEAEKKNMVKDYAWIWVVNNFEEDRLFLGGKMHRELNGLIGIRQATGDGPLGEAINKYWSKTGNILPSKPSVGRTIDSVLVVAKAVRDALQDGVQISSDKRGRICNESSDIMDDGDQGAMLSSYLRKATMDGFMGNITFDDEGGQISGIYDVANFHNNSINKLGLWKTNEKLNMFKNKTIIWNSGSTNIPRDSVNTLKNKLLKVVTSMSSPFTMSKYDNVTGKVLENQFEGAAIDILDLLKEALHFDYVIHTSSDGTVGNLNRRTGQWNGAIGELWNKTADLAIGPITISSHRSEVVDFTQPYMTTGLGVIMATEEGNPSFFGFLKPFSFSLWTVIIAGVLGMAVVNFVFSLLSPYGFYGRCVQSGSNEVKASYLETKHNLSLLNSIWSSAAYYLGQGPDGLHPISASGRATVAVWWFCITILTSTYTANLAAYLTTNRMQTPIAHVNDLSQQNEIDYGLIENSQTQRFFEESRLSRYLIMWEYMKLRRALVPNTLSGMQRVLKGKYAFIHDAPVLQYQARKMHCGQTKLIGGFDEKTIGQMSYGFALPKGSPYRVLINIEMLKIQQKGIIKKLIKKWMIDKTPCPPLDDANLEEESKTDAHRMGFMNMFGVFIFMFSGVVIGLICLIIEWYVAALRDSKMAKRSLPLVQAIRNRLRNLFKHVKNPEQKKLDISNPRSATRTTQTENLSEPTNMHHARYRPVSKAATSPKATGDTRKGLVPNKPRPKLQTMVVAPSNVNITRWPSTEV